MPRYTAGAFSLSLNNLIITLLDFTILIVPSGTFKPHSFLSGVFADKNLFSTLHHLFRYPFKISHIFQKIVPD